ncbi:hypothetical protein [Spirosoma sp.]|uniref:hypothetical protein n=1 Tax=Spirosoma sp. TaxID=1899569 RepID=UPI003B3A4E8A
MNYAHIFWVVLTVLGMTSCGKKDAPLQPQTDQRTKHNQLIDQQFTGNWKLTSIRTPEPIDANLDGMASTDLMTEIPNHAYVIAQLKVNWLTQKRVFADGYIRTYPATQTNGSTVQYVVNGRTLFFDVNEDRTQISLTDESETKTYPLTYTSADEFRIDGIERTYNTKSGWKTIPTTSTYQRIK